MSHARPDLVIFDCDGVLVDSEPLAAAALAETLTCAGLPTTAADCLDRYTGLSLDSIVAEVEDKWRRRLPADFRERLKERDYEAFREHLRPIEGVEAMLASLRIPRCVASSGSLEKLDVTLSATGLLRYFAPYVFSAEQVKNGKPAPDLFLHAAARMRVRPERCIVVEDSAVGVAAAHAAGMEIIGYAGGGHADDAYWLRLVHAGACTVVTRMNQLSALLDAHAGTPRR
jgi:HAD superfamily hydrolase (TIGR01509 family)